MKKDNRITGLVVGILAISVLSMGLVGCGQQSTTAPEVSKKTSDHPEHPKKTSDHPEHPKKKGDHPEHPKKNK